jgi:hypothetical protein
MKTFSRERGGLDGLNCHELAFYYLLKWDSNWTITSNSKSMGGLPERLEWLEISQLNNQAMQEYPTFFTDELLNLPSNAKHIVTYECDL